MPYFIILSFLSLTADDNCLCYHGQLGLLGCRAHLGRGIFRDDVNMQPDTPPTITSLTRERAIFAKFKCQILRNSPLLLCNGHSSSRYEPRNWVTVRSAGQEGSYPCYKSPPPLPVASHMNSIHTLKPYFPKIVVMLFSHLCFGLLNGLVFRPRNQNFSRPHALYMRRKVHRP